MRSRAITIGTVAVLAVLVAGTVYMLGREPAAVTAHDAPGPLPSDREPPPGPPHAAAVGQLSQDDAAPVEAGPEPPAPADPHCIYGAVEDVRRKAVPNARVSVYGTHLVERVQSDGMGTFAFRGLPEGTYAVEAVKTKYGAARVDSVAPGGPGLTLVLPDLGTVSGRVIDGMTGRPVSDFEALALAREHLPPTGVPSSRLPWAPFCDATGRFTLEGVPSGTPLGVAARSKRHAPTVVFIGPVPQGERAEGITITLAPGGRVEGRVVDQAGRSVAGAAVHVLPAGTVHASSANQRDQTDEAGRFSIGGLAAGPLKLAATHPGYFQGQTEAILRLGETVRATVTLHGGGRVAGRALMGGAPIEDGHVQVRADGKVPGPHRMSDFASTGPDGRYRIDLVPAGEVTVILDAGSAVSSGTCHVERCVLVRPGEETVVDFEVPEASCVVKGRITTPGDLAPRSRVSVTVSTPDYEMDRAAFVESDGSYSFEGLPPGTATLCVEVPAPSHVDRRQRVELQLTEGTTIRQDVSFEMSCTIEGRVLGEQEGEELFVFVLAGEWPALGASPLAAHARLLWVHTVSSIVDVVDGAFEVGQLEPGVYTVMAYGAEMAEGFPWAESPRYASEVVRLAPGSLAQMELALPPDGGH